VHPANFELNSNFLQKHWKLFEYAPPQPDPKTFYQQFKKNNGKKRNDEPML